MSVFKLYSHAPCGWRYWARVDGPNPDPVPEHECWAPRIPVVLVCEAETTIWEPEDA